MPELQQVFQNTQRLVDGNHQRFVPDRLGDVPPEFGRLQLFSADKHVFFLPYSFFCLKHALFSRLFSASRLIFFHLKFFHVSEKNVCVFQNLKDSLRTDHNQKLCL